MKTLHISIFASLVAVSPFLTAQPTASSGSVVTAPGSGKAEQTVETTATVVGIVPDTRTVSLKRADGKVVDIHAGKEVRNFNKIKVGDTVNAKYTQALSLELKKGGTGQPERTESASMARAPVGAQPSGTIDRKVTILADVVAVNNKDKLVTLRGPQGNQFDLKVQDPEQIKQVKQGDQVQAVYTEALAVAVEPASSTSSGK